jgi:alkanesulfonate monooxygenase SsuD/methylene tetrahydromethanopterin reductase-like flavin-dependent oxidoreductase (luciferase family)
VSRTPSSRSGDPGRKLLIVRIGVVLLPELDWDQDRDRWRRAEEYGFDHAWTYDHLAWRTLADGPWHATVPTLAAAALETSSIRLGTLVTTPNFRHPVPLAKDLMTLDVMSHGRLTVALGAGAPGYDASVLGQPRISPSQRQERFEEFHSLLDRLLSHPVTNWSGDWYEAAEARMIPGPTQRPRPPLLVAANGPRGMRLAAHGIRRPGDGWVTIGPRDADIPDDHWWAEIRKSVDRMNQVCAEVVATARATPAHRLLYLGARTALNSVDAIGEQLARAADLDFTDVAISWPRRSDPFQGDERLLEDIASALPELRRAGSAGRS